MAVVAKPNTTAARVPKMISIRQPRADFLRDVTGDVSTGGVFDVFGVLGVFDVFGVLGVFDVFGVLGVFGGFND